MRLSSPVARRYYWNSQLLGAMLHIWQQRCGIRHHKAPENEKKILRNMINLFTLPMARCSKNEILIAESQIGFIMLLNAKFRQNRHQKLQSKYWNYQSQRYQGLDAESNESRKCDCLLWFRIRSSGTIDSRKPQKRHRKNWKHYRTSVSRSRKKMGVANPRSGLWSGDWEEEGAAQQKKRVPLD